MEHLWLQLAICITVLIFVHAIVICCSFKKTVIILGRVCVCVFINMPASDSQTLRQTTCERKCLTNSKRVCICAQYSDPLQTFMLSHWQLWVIAPCSSPYPWTTFNYVTKCTCSPALMSPLESWTITFSLVLYKDRLPQIRKTCLLILRDKLTPRYLLTWVRDYPWCCVW